MKIFIGGETSGATGDSYRVLINNIELNLKKLEANNYGQAIIHIAIIPIIVEQEILENGFFRERKLIKWKSNEADMRLQINFDRYMNADENMRKLLLIKNIIDSIRVIGKRVKKDFQATQLEQDILSLFNLSNDQIDGIM